MWGGVRWVWSHWAALGWVGCVGEWVDVSLSLWLSVSSPALSLSLSGRGGGWGYNKQIIESIRK